MNSRTLIRQTALYMPAQLAGALMQFVSVILWTHWMAPSEYGRFALVLATQELLYLVLLCFWTQFVLRHLAGAPEEGRARLAGLESWVLMGNALIQTVVILAIAGTTADVPLSALFYFIAVAYTLTRSYATHLGDRARAEGSIGSYTVLQTVGQLLGLPLGLGLAAAQMAGADAALAGYAIAQALALILILRQPQFRPEWKRPERQTLLAAARYGLPMAASGLLFWASGSGIRFIVQHVMGTAAVGLFSVGWSLGQRATSVAAMLVTTAAFPLVLRIDATGQRKKALEQIAASGVLLFIVLAPCTAGLIVLARPLAQTLVAPDYVTVTAVILPIAALAGCVKNLRINFVNQAFLLAHRTEWSLVLDTIETALFLVLAFVGIRSAGLVGATAGTLIAMTICAVLAFDVARRRLDLPIPTAHLLKVASAAIGMALILKMLPPAHGIVMLLAAVLLGAIVYALLLGGIYFRRAASIAAPRQGGGDIMQPGVKAVTEVGELQVSVETDVVAALNRWANSDDELLRTPFQTAGWLATWYATIGRQPDAEPLLVTIKRHSESRPLMLLPLVRHKEGSLRRIEWADLGVTDYAAPLISATCPADAVSGRILLKALRRALPPADVLSFAKMPAQIGGRWNPFASLRGVQASNLFGNVVVIGDDINAWRSSLDRRQRKGLDRVWRVFTRNAGARFEMVEDPEQAMVVMDALERYQARIIEGKGWNYVLDQPEYKDFYRQLVLKGLADGSVVLTALRAGEEVVAALLGLWHEDTCAVLRIARGDECWSHCSPGRLLIDRTITALHPRGLRKLDLTIGDYRFKREFKPQVMPLCEMSTPLSLRGVPQVSFGRMRRALRQLIDVHLPSATAESQTAGEEGDQSQPEGTEAIRHGGVESPIG